VPGLGLAQQRHHPRIHLDRGDRPDLRGQRGGEDPRAGTDLEHVVLPAELRGIHDRREGGRIDEEVLPDAGGGADPVPAQERIEGSRITDVQRTSA